jgi:N-acetylglucosamine kinase-like BadF-type ATPase
MDSFILGVDGGQTSIKMMVTNLKGEIIWQTKAATASSGQVDNTILNIGDRLSSALKQIQTSTGMQEQEYEIAVLGMSGAEIGSPFISEFQRAAESSIHARRHIVVHDVLTNLLGASAGKPGVVVIAGGGAIAYGLTDDGHTWASNGWGYVVGDEGSAFSIGRTAINAVFKALDGRGSATRLSEYVFTHFHVSTAVELKYAIFQGIIHFDEIAGLAPLIARAATESDDIALSILKQAGVDLANSAVAVVHALYEGSDPVDVYPTGGLFNESKFFLPAFRDALVSQCPTTSIHKPIFEPVVGAILLGFKELGREIDENILQSLAKG